MASGHHLRKLRNTYAKGELLESEAAADPFTQFNRWMGEAIMDNLFEPNAMTLATVDDAGKPSCRTVLLKGVLEEGFIFYTNYESRKGSELARNPHAALLFWWREHERQVRIEGTVSRLPRELSVDYFNERPKGSRISAVVSPQSRIVPDRDTLDRLYEEALERYEEEDPECPEEWGGFILDPVRFEFWQGRPNRLHDRLEYRQADQAWKIARLAP